LPQAMYQIPVPAKSDGVVASITADEIGKAATMLGAGRATKDDVIDLAVGIVLHKKIGDSVKKGDTLLTIHSNQVEVDEVVAKIYDYITIADYAEKPKLIHTIITE
jgi:pyrimidine-nucleoside phosphorylase